jgi:hypothetical protein
VAVLDVVMVTVILTPALLVSGTGSWVAVAALIIAPPLVVLPTLYCLHLWFVTSF